MYQWWNPPPCSNYAPGAKMAHHRGPHWEVLSETKLFHFHGMFKKNETQSAKRTAHTLYIYEPTFQKFWIRSYERLNAHGPKTICPAILQTVIQTN